MHLFSQSWNLLFCCLFNQVTEMGTTMETHIIFFILAGVLIAILVGYSLWSARREKSRIFSNTFSTRPPATPVNNGTNLSVPPTLVPNGFSTMSNSLGKKPEHLQEGANSNISISQEIEHSVKGIKISLPDQPLSITTPVVQPDRTDSFATQFSSVRNDQIQAELNSTFGQVTTEPQAQACEAMEPIILYVVAPEGQQFQGNDIVQHLDNLGFQFGEHNIFHRHLDSSNTSPILFSVANMVQPGEFDLANIMHFSTAGLVFFMTLPSAGNDLVNLRLMLKTVENFAHSIGGFMMNDQQQIFDEYSRQAYLLKVEQSH